MMSLHMFSRQQYRGNFRVPEPRPIDLTDFLYQVEC
jgi:hypothetical protein